MDYYIQGDVANADKIKAAFEKLGINVLGFGFADKTVVYCSIGGACVQTLPYSINLMNILHSHPDYKELELQVKPKFKTGDWVVIDNCHNSIYQVDSVREYDYMLRHTHGGLMPFPFSSAERLSLWTIQDAKDGDVLATNSIICLFKKLDKDGYYIISHCIYTAKDGLEVIDDEGDSIGSCGFKPATKEDRKLLFRKMKEAGYEWDADKKELRKIKPHYDIANLRAGMPVLVRDANDKEWRYVLYSHNTRRYGPMRFNAGATIWNQCIPFNDDTKHLLGTTDMPYECYINW